MKIEKVNDNQIRCTLTKEDLMDRQIRLSELAYGSEKAKLLFRDMIQQANNEFGFEVNDIPLMVEAIPTSAESIILLITKVEYPEELDTRFSKFSEPDEDMDYETESDMGEPLPSQGADDILDLFERIRKEREAASGEQGANQPKAAVKKSADRVDIMEDLTRMFEFKDLSEVDLVAQVLCGYYDGVNDLYRNQANNRYYLLVKKSHHTPEEFNKVCNMICEYAIQKNYTGAQGAHLAEHGRLIIRGSALQTLAQL